MNPKHVKEQLETLTKEFDLPVTLFNSGPLLICDDHSKVSRERLEEVVQQWMDLERDEYPKHIKECFQKMHESFGLHKNHRNHSISIGKTVSEIYEEVEKQTLDAERIPEVREILSALIAERGLPFEIYYRGFNVIVLADDVQSYNDKEMIELRSMLEEENLDVQIRHAGFDITRTENGTPDILFARVQELTSRLRESLERHGLKTYLLQDGFTLEKNQEDEVHISEAKEMAIRLKLMSGIDFSAGGYGMGPEKDVKPGWTHEINWNSVKLYTKNPY